MLTIRSYKICPTVSSLQSTAITKISCPVDDCEIECKTINHLNSHLRTNHITDEEAAPTLCFHCPVNSCVYNKFSERHFNCFKYLKQHYKKIHAAKVFNCLSCNATFSQRGFLNSHLRQCGKTFECSCGTEYTTREALLTHAKRKQHEISDDFFSKKKKTYTEEKIISNDEKNTIKPIVVVLNEMKGPNDNIFKPKLLLPKPAPLNSIPLPTLAALALSELSVFRESSPKVDVSTQTDKSIDGCNFQHTCYRRNVKRHTFQSHGKISLSAAKRLTITNVDPKPMRTSDNKRMRCNTETQTKSIIRYKRQKTCAQTQTLDDQILEKAMAEANLLVTCSTSSAKENLDCFPRQSIHTQTMFEDDQPFWSTLATGGFSPLIRNSSSTQTQCNSSQTERDVFLGHMEASFNMPNFSSSPLSVDRNNGEKNHSSVSFSDLETREHLVQTCETQTELDLDSLLMCDENGDSDNILYSNNHTQTTDDNLESIPYDQLLMTHMHTQTSDELLFPELSFSDIQTQTSWTDFIFPENVQSSAQTQTRDLQLEIEFANSHTQTSKVIV